MSRVKVCLILLILGVVLSACKPEASNESPPEESAYKRIQEQLVGMQSYRSEATVEYKANVGSNVYDTVQHSRITGEYRVEVVGPENVAGNVTCSDGTRIYQYSKKANGRVSVLSEETQERSEIFLTAFVKNLLTSHGASVSVASMDEGVCTVFEASIPGTHPYLATQKLWVDNQTLLPVKMIIYDPDGAERIIITYQTFEFNVELDDSLFKV